MRSNFARNCYIPTSVHNAQGGIDMAARKSSKRPPRKTTAKKAAAKKATGRKAPARKKAARPKAPTPEALARKIVRVTQDASKLVVEDLYAEECQSFEPMQPEPDVGHEARRAKIAGWESFQDSAKAKWDAKNVFIKRNTICIEWEAELKPREGPKVIFNEVAVYETKGGKIVSERFYYNPAQLGGPAAQAEPARPRPVLEEPTGPQPDPLDL